MVRRVRSSFELEVFDQTLSAPRRLESFLHVYVKHLTPKHRTDTNQFLHYMRRPLPGRRIIYFGLTFRSEPCGFCVLMHYPAEKVAVFDFIVIAPTARGQGAYFVFADLISEYLERKRVIADYFVAEVMSDDGVVDPLRGPKAIVRLLRLQGFRRARITYHAPDPSIVRDLPACRASLMVASNQELQTIAAEELLKITRLVYFNHYLLWYGPFLGPQDRAKYEAALEEEHARLARSAKAHDPVILNGMKDADVRLEPSSERHRAALTVFLTASASAGLVAAIFPGVAAGSIVVALTIVILSTAYFSRRLRRLILRLFDQQG